MKKYFSRITVWLALFSLLVTLSVGTLPKTAEAESQSNNRSSRGGDRVSPDLRQRQRAPHTANASAGVILQFNGPMSSQLNALLNSNGVHLKQNFKNLNALSLDLPINLFEQVASFSEVSYLSMDRAVKSVGDLSATTGADAARQPAITTPLETQGVDGTGIGIAILDSGVYASHKAFLNKSYNSRIVFSRDFTGEGRTDDPYGHGTHVASIAAGNGMIGDAAYIGMAPNANLVNLRVLDSAGVGKVSNVLGALDWLIANRATYNIRVVNMSLGMPAIDSYMDDPLCKAVRKLVDAGVVVSAAAGNNGKDANGTKLYGQIHSPGNEPSAITVGAANSVATVTRTDDSVATYSSRGPTRSYWTISR